MIWSVMIRVAVLIRRAEVRQVLERLDTEQSGTGADLDDLRRTAIYVDRWLGRLPWPPSRGTCVPRSMVLFHISRRFGLDLHVHFGVRREQERLNGHAWLCRAGRPVLEDLVADEDFSTTFTFPEGACSS